MGKCVLYVVDGHASVDICDAVDTVDVRHVAAQSPLVVLVVFVAMETDGKPD